MGIKTTKGPKTEKMVFNSQTKELRYGVCEMQGWRREMEDASIAVGIFDTNSSLFGVMDGHGGSLISRFVATNFLNLLTHMKSYKQKNYEQALIETYLKFDELLRLDKVNQFLIDNRYQRSDKLGVNFSEKIDEDSNKTNEINHLQTESKKEDKENLNTNPPKHSKSGDNILPKENNVFKIPKEKIIDLTKGQNISDQSKKHSEESEKSRSREILLLDDQKVEISLKTFLDNLKSENTDDLIAKDMGTTANILLIKNNYLYLANVGDSLSVAYKNGQAIPLNQEHKTTLPSEFARISKSGAKIINNRVEGRLNLTRAIGDLNFKNNRNLKFYEQAVTAYPEITKMKITNDIEFIIMACDGVWDCVDPQKLCEHLSGKLKTTQSISEILGELFDQILSKTNNIPVGTDNMTCIVIQFLNNK